MYSLIHQRSVAPQQETVEIRGPSTAKPGEAIPPPRRKPGEMDKKKKDKTQIATTFTEQAPNRRRCLGKSSSTTSRQHLWGLRPGASALPTRTCWASSAAQTSWTQSEFGDLAASLGLLLNRAIEVLNEPRWNSGAILYSRATMSSTSTTKCSRNARVINSAPNRVRPRERTILHRSGPGWSPAPANNTFRSGGSTSSTPWSRIRRI